MTSLPRPFSNRASARLFHPRDLHWRARASVDVRPNSSSFSLMVLSLARAGSGTTGVIFDSVDLRISSRVPASATAG